MGFKINYKIRDRTLQEKSLNAAIDFIKTLDYIFDAHEGNASRYDTIGKHFIYFQGNICAVGSSMKPFDVSTTELPIYNLNKYNEESFKEFILKHIDF